MHLLGYVSVLTPVAHVHVSPKNSSAYPEDMHTWTRTVIQGILYKGIEVSAKEKVSVELLFGFTFNLDR